VTEIDAVVTDLDGTAVRRDGTVSDETLRAAAALRARGIPLVAATARTPSGVQALPALMPYLSFAVCCGGAIGYVPDGKAPAWRDTLLPQLVADLVSFVAREMPAAGLAAYDGSGWRMSADYRTLREDGHAGSVSVVEVAALAGVDACAMVVAHPAWEPPRVIAALRAAGFDRSRVGLTYAGSEFVEVTAPSVDKASGVVRALRTLGVPPERALALGDMPIDIAMFTAVGHSVAMADAPEEVRAAATWQTPNAQDDGFARALERLGLVTAAAPPR